ncbi:hypothetical protein FA13DRAFT_78634 [Coprinellus micaceus]|jgi:hypothetical protein|uniref:Uncharacterized protein n=1 Tax=Coprinellus micaceus TaxID=71717 RepID=A0A4Y7TJF5_COPMI|nr:hypothetical protein FA13DRAFT_78634 [Coprinellus micaceus]
MTDNGVEGHTNSASRRAREALVCQGDHDVYAGGSPGDLLKAACELRGALLPWFMCGAAERIGDSGRGSGREMGCDEVRIMGSCEVGTGDCSDGGGEGSNSGGGGALSGFWGGLQGGRTSSSSLSAASRRRSARTWRGYGWGSSTKRVTRTLRGKWIGRTVVEAVFSGVPRSNLRVPISEELPG